MPELTSGEINRKLDELLEGQSKTNEHLTKLNGRVGKAETWIAVRTDREEQAEQAGSKVFTRRDSWAQLAVLAVMIIALFLGVHGVA